MIESFQQIKSIIEDVRLNQFDTKDMKDYKLKLVEDICIKSIILCREIKNGNN